MADDTDRLAGLLGGYGVPYDPRPAVGAVRRDPADEAAWSELFQELHHQGDLGEASYAAIPLLVEACADGPRDWRFFGVVALVEAERHRPSNPQVPDWLADDYAAALQGARGLALADLARLTDPLDVCAAMSVVALAAGAFELGTLLTHVDSSEIRDWLDERGWTDVYDPGR